MAGAIESLDLQIEGTLTEEDDQIILTRRELQEIIEVAIQPLKKEIESLKTVLDHQDEKIKGLDGDIDLHGDNFAIQLRLINLIREEISNDKKESGKTERARAEKIAKYLEDQSDHRASFVTLKGFLGVNNVRLNEAIKTLSEKYPGKYHMIHSPYDKRKRILVMHRK